MPIVTIVLALGIVVVHVLALLHDFSHIVIVSLGHTVEVLVIVQEALDEIVRVRSRYTASLVLQWNLNLAHVR
jgi:hypothetical protein